MEKVINPVKDGTLQRWPNGDIYQGFGENVVLYQNAIGTNGHNGIDVIKKEGWPILGTAGVVCEVKNTPEGYGNHVRILTDPDENGDFLELTYGHLHAVMVPLGFRIKDGFQIGTMGNTGFVISGSTVYWGNAPAGRGVHLHFGIRECSTQQTEAAAQYSSGMRANIKNYNNGMKGAVDPLPYLRDTILAEQVSLYQQVLGLLKQLLKGR